MRILFMPGAGRLLSSRPLKSLVYASTNGKSSLSKVCVVLPLPHRTSCNGSAVQFFSTSSSASKWVSGRQAMGPGAPGSWNSAANPDDPVFYMCDKQIKDSPEETGWYYRSRPTKHPRLAVLMINVVWFCFWFNFFYKVYYDYYAYVGHFYYPAPEDFSDEMLGIPPDDAPDPEYWGDHSK